MPTSIMQKNYSHCPLKKRPVFIVKEESDSEMEPENLSTKPEDLSRTGKYPTIMNETKVIKTEIPLMEKREPVSPVTTASPTVCDYPTSQSPDTVPLNLHSKSSTHSHQEEPENFSNGSSWHKPVNTTTSNYLPLPAYPIPYASEAYNHMYHNQLSLIRGSSVSPPSYIMTANRTRESSTSPPVPVFIQPYSASDYRSRSSNIIKSEPFNQHRYMPYQLNHHHHHNLLTVDQSSLSPTSSHASYNSFVSSTSSRCSISPASTPSTPEDLTSNYSISVLMEKSNSNSNIQKPLKSEKSDKTSVPPRYQCPDCGKSYSTYSGLSKHQQFHCAANQNNQAQKTVTCNDCGKVYASSGALKMHIRTHTLPCKCHLCGKAFSRPWLLQGHIRTHTGEKPFSCQHCHRAFADRSNLRAHLQTHSDVKKYSCTSCNKTFSRMSLLTKHTESGCPGLQQHNMFSNQIVPSKDITVY